MCPFPAIPSWTDSLAVVEYFQEESSCKLRLHACVDVHATGTRTILPSQNWRFGLDERLNPEFSAALLEFNREAVVYCKGISDSVAQEYAMEYARMLQNRAKGIEGPMPKIPTGLFEPNRNLIRSTLDRMWQRYFSN